MTRLFSRLPGWCHVAAGLVLLLTAAVPASAQAGSVPSDDTTGLRELSLEELLAVEVTSVARKAQPVADSAAAVYVLTRADIRRSGALTIPDALRVVPGVQVARLDSNKWAVSVRGFNSRFANKLLVLVDGRTVYSPLFSGVFWETVDLPIEEIERIEVIRGPGGTMWGANAVNGVISIITTHARESYGTSVKAAAESLGPSPLGTFGQGWRIGDTAGVRLFARAFERDWSVDAGTPDRWALRRVGFRADGGTGTRLFSLQGNAYQGHMDQVYEPMPAMPGVASGTPSRVEVSGASLAGLLTRGRDPRSVVTLRSFVDSSARRELFADLSRWQADVDLQHRYAAVRRHDVVWGAGYRRTSDDVVGATFAVFTPQRVAAHLFSLFAQDEWAPTAAWHITGGLKFEHSTVAGGGWQPSVRALWNGRRAHTLWAAASRAVRTPSRAEQDLRIAVQALPPTPAMPLPGLVFIEGSRGARPEVLWAYEAGYRGRLGDRFTFDAAAFVNRYSRLIQTPPSAPYVDVGPAGPFLHVPLTATNSGRRHSRGLELATDWRPAAGVRVATAYTWLAVDRAAVDDLYGQLLTDRDPRHNLAGRLQLDLPFGFEVDPSLRWVSALANGSAPGYTAVDAHASRRLSRAWTLDLVGSNLAGAARLEFTPTAVNTRPMPVRRAWTIAATARF